MGYSNIIDSLTSKRVDEGLLLMGSIMNKRNSILESLSEGMITTANSKEVSKSSRAKLFCETVVKMRNGYLEDIYGVFGVITSSITKYTKPVLVN